MLEFLKDWVGYKNRKVKAIPPHLFKKDEWDADIQPLLQRWVDGESTDPAISCLNIRRTDYFAGYIIHRLKKPVPSPIIAASVDAQIIINYELLSSKWNPTLIMAEEMRHTYSWITRKWLRLFTYYYIKLVHLDFWKVPKHEGFWRKVWKFHRRVIDGALMATSFAVGLPYYTIPIEVFDKLSKFASAGNVPNMDCFESELRFRNVLLNVSRHVVRARTGNEDPKDVRKEFLKRFQEARITRVDPKERYIHSWNYDVLGG